MELMKKNHKILQNKYLKVTSQLRKKPNEELYLKAKQMKEEKLKRHFSGSTNSTNTNKTHKEQISLPLIQSVSIKKNVVLSNEENEDDDNEKNEENEENEN